MKVYELIKRLEVLPYDYDVWIDMSDGYAGIANSVLILEEWPYFDTFGLDELDKAIDEESGYCVVIKHYHRGL